MDEGTAEGKAEGKAEGTSGLTAMLFGEPVHSEGLKCKAWGLYTDDAGAQAAKEALMKLPQFAELVEPVQARPRPRRAAPTAAPAASAPAAPAAALPPHHRPLPDSSPRPAPRPQATVESVAPPVEPPPPPLPAESVRRHCERCAPPAPPPRPADGRAAFPRREAPAALSPRPAAAHALASPRPRRRCDEIVAALEARLDMAGACKAALGEVGEKCSEAERLQVT